MENQSDDFNALSEHAEDWHLEFSYHTARAAQEQALAARSTVPEAQKAHSSLAQCHRARATLARAVTEMPDAGPVRVINPNPDEE